MRPPALALLLAGCSATMIYAPGSVPVQSQFGPVDQATPRTTGLISFRANGASFVVKARREDAEKQMFDACSGRYRIVGQGPQQEGGTIVANGLGGARYIPTTFWYIRFACVQ